MSLFLNDDGWTVQKGRDRLLAKAKARADEERHQVRDRIREALEANDEVIKARDKVAIAEAIERALQEAEERTEQHRRKMREIATERPSMAAICHAVAAEHDVSIDDLRGPSRRKHHVAPRQQAMREIHEALPDISLSRIGRFFNRDHTTVLHALGRIKRR